MATNKTPKWKEPCGCWVDVFSVIKSCAKHQREYDETRAAAIRDKALIEKWNAELEPLPPHSRSGKFEFLGGPITWVPYVAPSAASPEDLTSLMT